MELVWRRISSKSFGGRITDTPHLVRVDHTYGPNSEQEWVIPACGARAGRGAPPYSFDTDPKCRRCANREERMARSS